MSSWYSDWSPNQKFMISIIIILGLFATILPSETWKVLVGFTGDQLDRDEVWITIEDYIDQNITDPITGETGSPYQTEKPALYGLGVVTITGTDYYYMIEGESGKLLDYHTTESVVLEWVRTNMTGGGNFYIVNNTNAYGYGFEAENLVDDSSMGTYVFGQAGEALTLGEMVYMETDGDYNLPDANSSTTMYCIGVAAQDIANTEWGLILIDGYIRVDSIYGDIPIGPRTPMYVSWTPGAITSNVPNTSGDQVQRIGYGVGFGTLRFHPDSTIIEIA